MIQLRVNGMTCGHCEQAVRRALQNVSGASRAIEVSRERELAMVEGNPDPNALLAAVRAEGYTAEVAK